MAYTVKGLRIVCLKNVVELKFTRRNKLKYRPNRRMLCTLNGKLLNSDDGKKHLNFRPARYPAPYDAESKGLLTVWDIIMQDYRNIPVAAVDIIVAIPVEADNGKKFWEFFNKTLSKMSAAQKAAFMDK